jgi:hypothetical protein
MLISGALAATKILDKTGEVIVKDDAGEMKTLMADPKAEGAVDLKMLKEGDPVSVQSDSDGIIKSLEVSK